MIVTIQPSILDNARSATVIVDGKKIFSGGHSQICAAFERYNKYSDSNLDPFNIRVSKELFDEVLSRVDPVTRMLR